MYGQYTLAGLAPSKKRKPCEYSFSRYIGQKVKDHKGIHEIAEIHDFYTFYTDNTCGTPHDMIPVDKSEYIEMIKTEIEYNEWMLNSKCDVNRGIAERNLKILREVLNNA